MENYAATGGMDLNVNIWKRKREGHTVEEHGWRKPLRKAMTIKISRSEKKHELLEKRRSHSDLLGGHVSTTFLLTSKDCFSKISDDVSFHVLSDFCGSNLFNTLSVTQDYMPHGTRVLVSRLISASSG